ncbi:MULTISPECIES: acetyl-CoA carboxylase biotin carboxylase subunit family protein [unclassified Mesorhizobium]|uniref:ATP-grasp domain-containing protein n=1 Tax=unclassified Mesorhizobium TaxID=325217 RepID=UPI000FE923F9|nr:MULTISPECIES: acetyl-CoA carboxylase biotin carboxylase subunit family protein [unclassified Mesorhizobium]RWE84945.1 MAG: ATP-grasp domain-containing protein [Mesorhizobium sp.]TGQ93131.1 ATP-grasp domain-containing protein [Mesorhizobium sp. M8A.F.Ca.ET.208.01.1.1]TGT53034.1 ATP-grasp domain-containing protein [Mesorhizobium sp. M8A.F.Ca.ET.167.01.1.1]TIR02226.1 MAG: ATP-grasp domain-containing protein [Mesorhizobium sp.]
MERRALILVEGASNMLRYVSAARRLGLNPIPLVADPDRYKYLAAEGIEAIRVDTNDVDALVRECTRLLASYHIAGITSALELTYAAAGKLCQYFDLPGPNPTSVELCCDKFTQRQLLRNAGVPIPSYQLATNVTEVESSAAQIGLPVVVKPAAGIGSVGVRLCRTFNEVTQHAGYLLGGEHIERSSPRILVEEFARGPHYSIEIMGNEVIGIAAADFGRPPHFVCREYIYPALLADDQYRRMNDVSLSCLRALGLGWGPSNIDLRWTELGPVVIEVNPRLGGTPTPQLVQLAYGVDLVTEHIKLAIGEESNWGRRRSQIAAARILLPDRDGALDWIEGSRAATVPGVAEVKFYIEPKTPIIRKGDSGDRIGHVMAASPTRTLTKLILQRAVDLIDWSIEPFPNPGE